MNQHHHPYLLPQQQQQQQQQPFSPSILFSHLAASPRRQAEVFRRYSKMEQAPHLLVQLVEMLFYCPALSWVARIQKFSMRCLPFLLPFAGFFAVVLRLQEDSECSCGGNSQEESKVQVRRQRVEDDRLSGRDVETVMEMMGIGCGRFEGLVGADDLNCLFEEKEPSLEEVKEAFCVFDRNGDGFIDAEELQRVLSMLGFKEGSTVDDCRRMIGAYDENKDGRIDFHEFVKFMEGSFC